MRSRIILTCLIAAGLAVAQSSVINVAPGEAEKNIVARVEPTIPPLARAARIGGNVVLRIRVSDAGNVTQVNVVSGHPMLQGAAMEAVRKWKYKPFTQNGAAVAIETQVTVAFSGGMSQSESDVRNKFFPQLEKCRGSLKEGDYPEAEKECSKAVDISNDLPKNVVLNAVRPALCSVTVCFGNGG